MLILMSTLMILGCGHKAEEQQPYRLQGAWLLQHVEYPSGAADDYDIKGNGTFCLIYEGDSMGYECRIATTPSGLVIIPTAKADVTLIDKGGGELLYLEDDDPHPLSIGDSTITIQRNGILYSWTRADDLYHEWGEEITGIITSDMQDKEAYEASRYVLSAKERQQERTIQWLFYLSVLIVLAALVAAHLAIINRKAKRQLQLQLQQNKARYNNETGY